VNDLRVIKVIEVVAVVIIVANAVNVNPCAAKARTVGVGTVAVNREVENIDVHMEPMGGIAGVVVVVALVFVVVTAMNAGMNHASWKNALPICV
jgi:hypothetical protein